MYCGNNREKLRGKRMGTRYECFKKGIGVGLNLPYDPDYDMKYEPIDNIRIYCGKENILPIDYNVMGNPRTCLQKGVGVGKSIKAKKRKKLKKD